MKFEKKILTKKKMALVKNSNDFYKVFDTDFPTNEIYLNKNSLIEVKELIEEILKEE